jgi:hydroxyacylglutathione hydrolase
MPEIKTITLKMIGGLASVNCYLLKTATGFILIDTGISGSRSAVEKELQDAGCNPGDINLILITHGDSDHTGNASYLREKYGTPIALHQGDSGMVIGGNMLYNRKGNFISRLISPFMGLAKNDRFKPDFYVDDGYDLSQYGLDARIIHIPGHSSGSIGIITDEVDLFCGDLLTNTKEPAIGGIIDDKDAAQESIEKLKKMNIKKVYPGHGEPFNWNSFII